MPLDVARDAVIAVQARVIGAVAADNARLAEQAAGLAARVERLERLASRNSGNSSMPPSAAARLAARIWTVTAAAEMAGLNVRTYLTACLDACDRNGGKPPAGPDLEQFLPRNAAPRRPARLGTATPAALQHPTAAASPAKRSRRLPACPLTRFPNTYIGERLLMLPARRT